MKRSFIFLLGLLCIIMVEAKNHYQNFYEFPIKSLNYLVIICFDL